MDLAPLRRNSRAASILIPPIEGIKHSAAAVAVASAHPIRPKKPQPIRPATLSDALVCLRALYWIALRPNLVDGAARWRGPNEENLFARMQTSVNRHVLIAGPRRAVCDCNACGIKRSSAWLS
jgi:hypothetical protein